MSGEVYSKKELDACRSDLLSAIVQAKERAELGRANESKARTVEQELQNLGLARDALRETAAHMKNIYKNIEQYASDRKELALEMLKVAIEKAGYIVPDADVNGIQLKTGETTARIVNKYGQDINLREGSAYRSTMGMHIRYGLLKADPDAIQAIFLDEAFGTLSDETKAAMRNNIDVFKDDTLIVGIEQQGYLFEGIEHKTLRAIKGQDKVTEIIEE